MFRSRFSASFPAKLPHFGPQDIERGVVDTAPSPQIEDLLCAILALALNRKKPIEYVLREHISPVIIQLCILTLYLDADTMDEHWKKQSPPTSTNGLRLGMAAILLLAARHSMTSDLLRG